MALILKNGAVFLHIPKTGGNWITKVLKEMKLIERKACHKHVDYDRLFYSVERNFGAIVSHVIDRAHKRGPRRPPFMFCFVRHPLSWYESWFKYMSQPTRQWRNWGNENNLNAWHPNSVLNGLGSDDFNQFLRNLIEKRPGYVTEMFGWYAKPQVRFVGKQENLREDLVRALKLMNIEFDEQLVLDYPEVGVSKPSEDRKTVVWDPALREEVLKLEYAALARYGYGPEAGK